MNCFWTGLALGASISTLSQQPAPKLPRPAEVMIAAVSRNDSVLVGGVSSGRLISNEGVDVEPLARLTSLGTWKNIGCDENHPKVCRLFAKNYLSKPHTYKVVSAHGWGDEVRIKKMSLDECFGYGGRGTYSGRKVGFAAVAASSDGFFSVSRAPILLDAHDADVIRQAFARVAGNRLDSTRYLRVYSLHLQDRNLFAIQRAFQDYASQPTYDSDKDDSLVSVFAIGTMKRGQFHILSWQNEVNNDENEQILGTIHLKTGKDFLVDSVSDSESQFFRIYGVQAEKLTLIYKGGGGSC